MSNLPKRLKAAAQRDDDLSRYPDEALLLVVQCIGLRSLAKLVMASPIWREWCRTHAQLLIDSAHKDVQHVGVLLTVSTTTLVPMAHAVTHAVQEGVQKLLRLEAEKQEANKSDGLKQYAYANHLLQYVSSDAYLRFEPHVRVQEWFIDVCIKYVKHGRRRVGCGFIRRLFWCVGPVFSAPLLHKFNKAVEDAFNAISPGQQENVIDLLWKTSLFVDKNGRSSIDEMAHFIVDDDEVPWQQALNGILRNFVRLPLKLQVKTAVMSLRSLLCHELVASATFVYKELLKKFRTTLSPEHRLKACDKLLRLGTLYHQTHWQRLQRKERELAVQQLEEKFLLERDIMRALSRDAGGVLPPHLR